MIEILFRFASEKILVKIDGTMVKFASTTFGAKETSIEGLQLDYSGAIKEFPDLKDKDDWREITIERFKDKIKSLKTEEERAEYIIEDLRNHGYIPELKQRKGHRPEKIS